MRREHLILGALGLWAWSRRSQGVVEVGPVPLPGPPGPQTAPRTTSQPAQPAAAEDDPRIMASIALAQAAYERVAREQQPAPQPQPARPAPQPQPQPARAAQPAPQPQPQPARAAQPAPQPQPARAAQPAPQPQPQPNKVPPPPPVRVPGPAQSMPTPAPPYTRAQVAAANALEGALRKGEISTYASDARVRELQRGMRMPQREQDGIAGPRTQHWLKTILGRK